MNLSIFGRTIRSYGTHSSVAGWSKLAIAALVVGMASCNTKPSSSTDTTYPSDLVSDNTKGPVTQIETDSYLLDSTGKPAAAIDEKYLVKYDSSGFVTSVTTSNGKDSVKNIATYTHNAKGMMLGQVITDGNNKKKSSLTVEYDSTGKPTIAISYDSTGKMDMYFTDIGLSKYGKITSGKAYHPDSTIKFSFVNDFDSIHYIGGSSKDSVGKETYSATVQLDSLGNAEKMEETSVSLDSATKKDVTKKTTTTYTYGAVDSHGNWTEQTEHITGDDKTKVPHFNKRILTYKQ